MDGLQPLVHIVDDDADSAVGVQMVLNHSGLKSEIYGSGEEFLKRFVDVPEMMRCMLLDIRMPGMSGLGLLKELAARMVDIPAIVYSSYTNVSLAVEAMKAGAMDVLEKPVSGQVLLERVQMVLDQDATQASRRVQIAAYRERKQRLSDREAQVMELLLQGHNAKQIANNLCLNAKTVMKYRTELLHKMDVDSVAELIRISSDLGQGPETANKIAYWGYQTEGKVISTALQRQVINDRRAAMSIDEAPITKE